ncbi:hypothetical protein BH23ACT9_BH23ACT9_29700 [soil metagenome]
MTVLRWAAALGIAAATWTVVHARSPAVSGWSEADRSPIGDGPLFAVANRRQGVEDEPVVVLLHGIVGSGRSWGATYDEMPAAVVVLDVLGFGRSMSVPVADYSRSSHLGAVRDTLAGAGLSDRPIILVGHSMGSVLALHAAAAMDNVVGAVAISAPLYDSVEEGMDHIGAADPLASLVAVGDVAERICGWMCKYRRLARALWPILAIRWPVPVAADGVLHTWPAYRGSLQSLVLDSGYRAALATLRERGIPVRLVNGDTDGVPVTGHAEALAATHANTHAITIAGGGHGVPLSHPQRCRAVIESLL